MAEVTSPGTAAGAPACGGPPVAELKNGLFVAWKDECFRSRATARTFGCPVVLLGAGSGGFSRYLSLMVRTWRLLDQRRPRTVVCLNQPPMLPLVCGAWTWLHGGAVIQDFHSGALSHRRWRPFRCLYRRMTRRAPFTLVHNREDARRLAAWGAATALLLTLPDAPDRTLTVRAFSGRPRFLFVCTFAEDEPVHQALGAFSECPEVDFWVSGNYRKAGLTPADVPSNVRLLGFVDYRVYAEAMASSSAVITLSKRPHIMQMAVEEAITMGLPVLTNESPTLEEALGDAGVFVRLSPQAIAEGVREVAMRLPELRAAARCAQQRCWQAVAAELQRMQDRSPELFR
jgi:glycosyltransferase involved in cell wall biosynthesis